MKPNFQPWGIDLNDYKEGLSFREKVIFFLSFAILAPSSHNSQPWKLKITKRGFSVQPEKSRRLLVGDKKDRLLYISLGCLVENFSQAADYFGFKAKIRGTNVTLRKMRVKFSKKKNHLVNYITKRTTRRGKYKDKQIDQSIINAFKQLAGKDIRIDFIDDSNLMQKVARIVIDSGIKATSESKFRLELAKHIKNNNTRSKVGMPAYGYEIPTPISYIAPIMVKVLNMNKLNEKKDYQILTKYTSTCGFISVKKESKKNWIESGRIFQRMYLSSTRKGISIHPMAAPIQIGQFYRRLQSVLNTKFRPVMFFRMGYAVKDVNKSPRLSVSDVLIT